MFELVEPRVDVAGHASLTTRSIKFRPVDPRVHERAAKKPICSLPTDKANNSTARIHPAQRMANNKRQCRSKRHLASFKIKLPARGRRALIRACTGGGKPDDTQHSDGDCAASHTWLDRVRVERT